MKQSKTVSVAFFRLFRYRVYRRMLIIFSSTVVLLAVLIGLLLYFTFSNYAAEQTAAYSTDLMSQRVNSTQTLWEEMRALSTGMSANPAIRSFMTMRETDQILRYHAFRELSNYKALYSFVTNISLVNLQCDQKVTLLYYVDDRELVASLKDIDSTYYSFSRKLQPMFSGKPIPSVLTIFYPIRYFGGDVTCGIVIDINQSHLHSMLQGTDNPELGSSTYIIDDEGAMIFQPDESQIPQTDMETFQRVLSSEETRGSFFYDIDGHNHLITFCRFPNQSWNVITIQPTTHLLAQAYSTIRTVVTCLCGVLLCALLAVFFFSRRVYQPLGVLADAVAPKEHRTVDEIEAISSELSSIRSRSSEMEHSLLQSAIPRLLFGLPVRQDMISAAVANAQAFSVAILTLRSEQTSDESLHALADAVRECFSEVALCETVVWSDRVVVLFCLPSPAFSDAALFHFETVNQFCLSHYHCPVRACVSDIVFTQEQIHDAFGQVQQVSKGAFYLPNEIVLTSRDIKNWNSVPNFTVDEWSRRILSGLYAADENHVQEKAKEFLKLARQQHPLTCCHATRQLLCQCLDGLQSANYILNASDFEAILNALSSSPSYKHLEREALVFLHKCIQTIAEGEQERGVLHNQRIAQQVCAFIQQNYTNPDLSLQNAADEVKLSSSYLGRLFKQSIGQSFSEYLTAYRLNAACEMLLETSKPVASIAEAVGLGNPSYFSTLFKKAYSISPSMYRETGSVQKTTEA